MVQIYSFSVESSNNHAVLFSEASALNLEFNALQQWMHQHLQDQDQANCGGGPAVIFEMNIMQRGYNPY